MNQLKQLLAAFIFFAILTTGCKKDIQHDISLSPTELQGLSKTLPNLSTQLTPAQVEQLNLLRASLPAGAEKRLEHNAAQLLKVHPEYADLVQRALHVAPTPCDANTPITLWLDNELADWNNNLIFFAIVTGMLDFPFYDALLFENSSSNQVFGIQGQYSQRLTKTFKDLKRFWNIQSDGIILGAMHGGMLRDRNKLIRIDMIVYGDSPANAAYWADVILSLLQQFPQYRNGDHPIFTFNAFAQPSFNFPPYGIIPDKVIMGDGIMDGYTGVGYEDVAPQAILAHEFGHHIQFQLGVYGNATSPEATRRTELMADAYSAYYLSHARGASMQWKRVKQFLQVFFNIGDCAFNDNGHHGTPTQRLASAEWAYNLANDAQKQGHILTSQQFTALFEAALPGIVAH